MKNEKLKNQFFIFHFSFLVFLELATRELWPSLLPNSPNYAVFQRMARHLTGNVFKNEKWKMENRFKNEKWKMENRFKNEKWKMKNGFKNEKWKMKHCLKNEKFKNNLIFKKWKLKKGKLFKNEKWKMEINVWSRQKL